MGAANRKPFEKSGVKKKKHKENGSKKAKEMKLEQQQQQPRQIVPEVHLPSNYNQLDKPDKPINFTIHRSYGNLDQSKFGSYRDNLQILSDVKIYEKITTKSSDNLSTASLPRNWLRRTSSKLTDKEEENHWKRTGSSKSTRLSIRRQTTNHKFPLLSEIRHKLDVFESHFTIYLSSVCSQMPHVQRVCVAVEGDDRISLRSFLNSNLPDVLPVRSSPTGLIATIPAAFCQLLARLKANTVIDDASIEVIGREIVSCVAKEISSELSRIYEYQIIMILEDNSIRLLAEHCCNCIMELLNNTGAGLERNSALQAVLYVLPKTTENSTVLSVLIGQSEVKWTLANVLKMCGLRSSLDKEGKQTTVNGTGIFLEDERKCVEDTCANVERYGYRGQCLLWNYVRGYYYLDEREERFIKEVAFVSGDVHQSYSPIRTLVGHCMMLEYIDYIKSQQIHQGISFKDFFRGKTSASVPADARLIYRPTTHLIIPPDAFGQANLDGLDLTRFILTSGDLTSASLRHVFLSQARLSFSNLKGALLNGSNLAYADLRAAQFRQQQLQEVSTAEYTIISDSELVDSRGTEPVRVDIAFTRFLSRLEELRTREILPSSTVATQAFAVPVPISPTTLRQLKRKRKKAEDKVDKVEKPTINRPQSMSPKTLPRSYETSSASFLSPKHKSRSISANYLVRNPSIASGHAYSLRTMPSRTSSFRRSCFLHQQSMEDDIQNVILNLKESPIAPRLPPTEPLVVGRRDEFHDLISFITNNRITNVNGPPLVGKSIVLQMVAHHFQRSDKFIPIYIDFSGILITSRFFQILCKAFNLKLKKRSELSILIQWIRSVKKEIILFIDNISVAENDFDGIFDIFDGILKAENVRIVTGHSTFIYSRTNNFVNYSIPPLKEQDCIELLAQVLTEVERDTLIFLASSTSYVPGIALLAARALLINQASLSSLCDNLPKCRKLNIVDGTNDTLNVILENVLAIFNCFSYSYQDVIRRLSVFASWSDIDAVEFVVGDKNIRNIKQLLDEFEKIGAVKIDDDRYLLHPVLKMATSSLDNTAYEVQYHLYYSSKIEENSRLFHTENYPKAVKFLDDSVDNFFDIIQKPNEIETYIQEFSKPLTILYLEFSLIMEDFVNLYKQFLKICEENNLKENEASYLTGLCLSLNNLEYGLKSTQLYNSPFSDYVYGLALCNNNKKQEGTKLIKLALDSFRTTLGLRHALSVYAYERYAGLLVDEKKFQMARHYFNLSDLCVQELLGNEHPLLLHGFDSRHRIWKDANLFSRAVQSAKTASKIANYIYGPHQITSLYLQRYVDALTRRGTIGDAIQPIGESLTILHRTKGVHLTCLEAGKMLLELLVKTGYYEYVGEIGNYCLTLIKFLGYVKQQHKSEIIQLIDQAKQQLTVQEHSAQITKMQTDTGSKGTLLSDTTSSPSRNFLQTDL